MLLFSYLQVYLQAGFIFILALVLSVLSAAIVLISPQFYRVDRASHPYACTLSALVAGSIGFGLGFMSIKLGTWLAPAPWKLDWSAFWFQVTFIGVPALLWALIILHRLIKPMAATA